MQKRKFEYFDKNKLKNQIIISSSPQKLYPQERDWTCSIACIRSLLSGIIRNVPSEDFFINTYKLEPSPYFSQNLKNILIDFDINVICGCDIKTNDFDDVLDLAKDKHFIMLESMYNCSHWIVFLGYYPTMDEDIENSNLLVYDPYYDNVKLINTDEFITMWKDGENKNIQCDFIAIK